MELMEVSPSSSSEIEELCTKEWLKLKILREGNRVVDSLAK